MSHSQRPTTAVVPIPHTITPVPLGSQAPGETAPITRLLYSGGPEACFPMPGYERAVYQITFSGTILYTARRGEFSTPEEEDEVILDAFCYYNRYSGPRHRHKWLLINDLPLDHFLHHELIEAVQTDYEAHTYRFLIDHPEHEPQLRMLLEKADGHSLRYNWRKSYGLTAIVQALPAATPPLKEWCQKGRNPQLPSSDHVREGDLRTDETRAKDFHTRLMAIACREQEALADLDRMVGIPEEQKNNYRQEVKDFAAGEIANLSASRNEGAPNVKAI